LEIDPVRTVIVGCGMVSDIYLQNTINNFKILGIVGCSDINRSAADEKARKYHIRSMTFEEILSDPSIEMVINLTSPKSHYEVIRRLLEADKNVYTEKIMTIDIADAKKLVTIANERKLYLGAAPDTFLGAGLQTAKMILDSGLIGEVTSCNAVLTRDNNVGAEFIPYIANEGGGIGFDVGIYYTTALTYLLGPASEVSGFMTTRNGTRKHIFPHSSNFGEEYDVKCENVMAGSIRFRSGAYGTVLFNSESIMTDYPELTLHGTQGIMYLPNPDFFGGEVRILRRGNDEPFTIQQNHGYTENSRGVGSAEMAWAMRKRRTPRANKEMAYHALEILHGISVSAATRANYSMQSSHEAVAPLPQGHIKKSKFADFLADEEAALAE
jgi:predicted dehydrogenase